jgi:hypothetical protein
VNTVLQADIDDATRELERAYREYEQASQDVTSLPPIATHERAALIQRKVEAWNSLEAAKTRHADVVKRAASAGMRKV